MAGTSHEEAQLLLVLRAKEYIVHRITKAIVRLCARNHSGCTHPVLSLLLGKLRFKLANTRIVVWHVLVYQGAVGSEGTESSTDEKQSR